MTKDDLLFAGLLMISWLAGCVLLTWWATR